MHKYEEGKGSFTPELFDLCRFIDEKVEFRHFYAGHWHRKLSLDDKHTIVYDKLHCPDME